MDETIDLRPYVKAVVRHLWLIGAGVVLAIVVSALVFLSRNDFQAAALVTVPEPTQQLQFDPRIISNTRSTQLLTAYPQLALSDDVLIQLLPVAQDLAPDAIGSVDELRSALDVIVSPDARIVRLSATSADPRIATVLANTWADKFIEAVELVYGRGGLSFYTEQLDQASGELADAETALVSFQGTNRQGIVDSELTALTSLQATYLNQQNAFRVVLDNLETLRVQLENNASDVVVLADQLAALSLQLQSYQVALPAGMAVPFQLNITSDSQITAPDRAAELQRLDALRLAVEAALASRESQLRALEPMIFALQSEKQQLFNENARLNSRLSVAMETYTTLARKVDEERVATRETVARLASRAAEPETPARPNLLVLLPLSILVALFLTTAAIVLLTWWREARA